MTRTVGPASSARDATHFGSLCSSAKLVCPCRRAILHEDVGGAGAHGEGWGFGPLHVPADPPACRVIPAIMSERDTLVQALTGSGKTLAFLLPALSMLDYEVARDDITSPGMLVVTPTRELGVQIFMLVFKLFGGNVNKGIPGDAGNMFRFRCAWAAPASCRPRSRTPDDLVYLRCALQWPPGAQGPRHFGRQGGGDGPRPSLPEGSARRGGDPGRPRHRASVRVADAQDARLPDAARDRRRPSVACTWRVQCVRRSHGSGVSVAGRSWR